MCYEYGLCEDCAEQHALYKPGETVSYRGDFGAGNVEIVTIEGIGEKNGRVVYDLSNGRWCYETQIINEDRRPVSMSWEREHRRRRN
jgi:hypothetical protein